MKHLVTLLGMAWVVCLHAQLEDALDDIALDYNLMGMSVVTVCGGEVQEVYHHGLKDYTRNLPVDDSTMYRIASISKCITATGLMILHDQGLVDWDDDISDILGYNVRNPGHEDVPITVGMVLSHRSSLQDGDGYFDFLTATYNFSELPPAISELLLEDGAYYTTNIWRTEAPGSFFAYSNANFGLAATLIEALSGQRFDVFMREALFEPLGIAGSFNVADLENIDHLAVLYRNQGGWTPQVDNYQGVPPVPWDLEGYVPGSNGVFFAPQGGLRISPLDLARIMLLHANEGSYDSEQIISEETMQEMHAAQWTYDGSNGDNYYNLFQSWGLGIQRTTNAPGGDIVLEGMEMLGHPGEAYGLISDFYFSKEEDFGIIFMTNGAWNGFDPGQSSAFYTLEEAVFEAVTEHALGNCILSTPSPSDPDAPHISPNPAEDEINVRVGKARPFWKRWFIKDSSGRVLMSSEARRLTNFTIDVSAIPRGIYVLELQNETESRSIRWVKS